ncbi:MAG: thioredoxin [Oscillospiraceae bacterium]|jgi:thioredoxin 1|nr:thioredoxin [Oscillospiraceae bacterium]
MVKEIKDNNFEAVNNAKLAVVDFNADWCGPCKMLAPIIEELADEMDDVEFFACNVDDNMKLAQEFGIMSIPAVGVFKNGKLVDMSVGYKPKGSLELFISANS